MTLCCLSCLRDLHGIDPSRKDVQLCEGRCDECDAQGICALLPPL